MRKIYKNIDKYLKFVIWCNTIAALTCIESMFRVGVVGFDILGVILTSTSTIIILYDSYKDLKNKRKYCATKALLESMRNK